MSGSRRRVRLVAIVATALLLTGCLPELILTYDRTSTSTPLAAAVYPGGGDSFVISGSAGALDIVAPDTNTGGSLREVFWPSGAAVVADSQSCATWTSQHGRFVQQGAAFRIRQESTGRVRAITVSKNVMFGIIWGFNFYSWDTNRDPSFAQFGSTLIPGLLDANGVPLPLPWHLCARVIGPTIQFKVWTNSMAEPAWGNSAWGGHATIPTGWTTGGTTGWYIGHLAAGDSAHFDNLRTWRWSGTPPPIVTTSAGTSITTSSTTEPPSSTIPEPAS